MSSKDDPDSGADVALRLREYHALAGQPGVLGLDVIDGELSGRDAIFDKSIVHSPSTGSVPARQFCPTLLPTPPN